MFFKRAIIASLLSVLLTMGINARMTLSAEGRAVDNSIYAKLLNKFVKEGKVNYAGFQSEEAKLDQYLNLLQHVDPETLSHNEQFAFYANAYNAWTIKLILTKYPDIRSIKELGFLNSGPWKKKVVRLQGEMVSLDHIEHEILRPRFKDPRVHFAINCAAKSCPPLRSEPYRGNVLDQQLDDATRSFINDPESYRLEGSDLYVSKIFKWFSEDFSEDPLDFVLKYANANLRKKLKSGPDKINVKYLEYDWTLNGT